MTVLTAGSMWIDPLRTSTFTSEINEHGPFSFCTSARTQTDSDQLPFDGLTKTRYKRKASNVPDR